MTPDLQFLHPAQIGLLYWAKCQFPKGEILNAPKEQSRRHSENPSSKRSPFREPILSSLSSAPLKFVLELEKPLEQAFTKSRIVAVQFRVFGRLLTNGRESRHSGKIPSRTGVWWETFLVCPCRIFSWSTRSSLAKPLKLWRKPTCSKNVT